MAAEHFLFFRQNDQSNCTHSQQWNKSVKVFKNEPSKICGRQPLKIWGDMVSLSRPYHLKFLKAVFCKFYLVLSWILWPKHKILFQWFNNTAVNKNCYFLWIEKDNLLTIPLQSLKKWNRQNRLLQNISIRLRFPYALTGNWLY